MDESLSDQLDQLKEEGRSAPQRTPPITIGVAGGSGAGKTTVVQVILDQIGRKHIASVQHDAYYHDLGDLPPEQRVHINFDHPDSLDTDLFVEHIKQLKNYQSIELPVYDFSTYTRTDQVVVVPPHRVILIEGILIFADPRVRELIDVRIFVDTPDDIRFIRRLQRDTRERGRTMESVVHQWIETVRPMYLNFVEPSKRHAHVIIPEGGYNEVAMEMLIARIQRYREYET
ncbi:MAG: uridine kinase [Chloroflexi bacterium]|nr:uridine kinase [Chloroflexota bacterium]